ncbi:hypothetical protein DICVIV_12418 [Dictyocaulus viviparus]|uniref:Uncharacterized protein n=1 Tax=Dictyocaulus viviparus TaxID=29172 RepID=A0A0D8XD71_DICVI|nr:hypothetical protein DICVIV_12418 [Dictyocaulus viviparus]
MVPFLQMANGEQTKSVVLIKYVAMIIMIHHLYCLFAHMETRKHIKVGSPIYTEGSPCDSCKDRCPFFKALCDTEIA